MSYSARDMNRREDSLRAPAANAFAKKSGPVQKQSNKYARKLRPDLAGK